MFRGHHPVHDEGGKEDPSILNASRRKRIAAGSGQPVQKINQLVKRYEEARKMMKQMMKPGAERKMNRMFRGFKGSPMNDNYS